MSRLRLGELFDCDRHGVIAWLGHVVCDPREGGCGQVYKRTSVAPLICNCKRRLLPMSREPRDPGDQQFTGRVICPHCYRLESSIGAATKIDVLDDPFS